MDDGRDVCLTWLSLTFSWRLMGNNLLLHDDTVSAAQYAYSFATKEKSFYVPCCLYRVAWPMIVVYVCVCLCVWCL